MTNKDRNGERGSTMVETALVMGLFLMLVFGIMDFSRALYTYHMVDNAARLGTRFAIVRGSSCVHTGTPDPWPCPTNTDGSDIQSYVRGQSVLLGSGALNVSSVFGDPATGGANPGCPDTPPYNSPGCLVTVTVSYDFHFLLPFISTLTIPMTSTSQMVISQ